mmetsp:Transcript_47782/g.153894  ORF Transcript_47782/g.153894 Transcript_47782/m.153894 type:complete len:282 (+) Transcript_47782:397-1242(+)
MYTYGMAGRRPATRRQTSAPRGAKCGRRRQAVSDHTASRGTRGEAWWWCALSSAPPEAPVVRCVAIEESSCRPERACAAQAGAASAAPPSPHGTPAAAAGCLATKFGAGGRGKGSAVWPANGAAAAAGAAHVTLTDRDLSASSASLSLNPALQGAVDVRRLAWGDAPSLAAALSAAGGRFEVVLAADVVYPQSTAALPALLETVRNATAPLGRALLLYVERDARVSEALGAGLRGFGGACGRVELGAKAALFELGGAGGGAGGGRPRGCDAVPGGGRVGAC